MANNLMKILMELKKQYRRFEWLALMRLLKKLNLKNIHYFFKGSPSMGFPGRELAEFEVRQHDVVMTLNFLSLQGAATPLPLYFSEAIVQDDPRDSNLNELLNFFNQRFYEALLRIDEKYHYLAQASMHYTDPLSKNLRALCGLPEVEGKERQALYYRLMPGLRYWLGGQVSKQGLCLFLQSMYQVKKVSLRERVKREVFIPLAVQSILGADCIMGKNLILGRRVYQGSAHFELHFYVDDVVNFLPGQPDFVLLQEMMNLVLKSPLWVSLVLHANCVQAPILKGSSLVQLGYTSVLTAQAQHAYSLSLRLL